VESSGAMLCVPGWHKKGVLPVCDQGHLDFTAAITTNFYPAEHQVFPFSISAGQACVNHPLMPHKSGPNRSPRWRRALVLRYRQRQAIPRSVDWAADFRTGLLFAKQSFPVRVQSSSEPVNNVARNSTTSSHGKDSTVHLITEVVEAICTHSPETSTGEQPSWKCLCPLLLEELQCECEASTGKDWQAWLRSVPHAQGNYSNVLADAWQEEMQRRYDWSCLMAAC